MAKIHFIRKTSARFCAANSVDTFAKLLKEEAYKLQLLSLNPKYNVFSVPKKDGTKRWIEDPADELQAVQEKLGFMLGATYFFQKTEAAYGFIISPKKDPSPRNIVTNARRHLGCKWMLNADLKDFFHQIKAAHVFRIFSQPPFDFSDELADLLTRLCTHLGRLPMGAPTSPVLSNFATIKMDEQLLQLADWAGWAYTRYADDLCFSSPEEFSETDFLKIRKIVEACSFEFNENKFKRFGPEDCKEVTGIQLGENDVRIPDGFLKALHTEIVKLRHVIEVANRMGKRERWIKKFQQQIEGKIAFVQFVHGDDPVSNKLEDLFEDALDPPDKFGAKSWLDFGYF